MKKFGYDPFWDAYDLDGDGKLSLLEKALGGRMNVGCSSGKKWNDDDDDDDDDDDIDADNDGEKDDDGDKDDDGISGE